ncbi:MAG: peptidoglycan bridge formation glycyltransferase FemA/FemB family protein [Bacilli bacterium]|nr:peptidoglycan bridge formation glycyltransferase FemA/FemB family protein [Bacilli bacterium]
MPGQIGRQDRSSHLRYINNLKELGFEFTPGLKHGQTIQTRHNYMLCNLKGKTEDEVFMSIGAKSRNCIRGAIKKGVECKQYPVSNIDKFSSASLVTRLTTAVTNVSIVFGKKFLIWSTM